MTWSGEGVWMQVVLERRPKEFSLPLDDVAQLNLALRELHRCLFQITPPKELHSRSIICSKFQTLTSHFWLSSDNGLFILLLELEFGKLEYDSIDLNALPAGLKNKLSKTRWDYKHALDKAKQVSRAKAKGGNKVTNLSVLITSTNGAAEKLNLLNELKGDAVMFLALIEVPIETCF